jgi:hypothetical protein
MSIKTCLPLVCVVITVIFTVTPTAPVTPTPAATTPSAQVLGSRTQFTPPVLHVPSHCVKQQAVVSVSGSEVGYIEYRGRRRSTFFGVSLKPGQHETIHVVVLTANGHRYLLHGKVCRRG